MQPIRRLGPNAVAIKLRVKDRNAGDRMSIDRNQLVTRLNSGACSGTVRIYMVGNDITVPLQPPNAVVGRHELTFLAEIDPGENNRRSGQQEQEGGHKASLKVPV